VPGNAERTVECLEHRAARHFVSAPRPLPRVCRRLSRVPAERQLEGKGSRCGPPISAHVAHLASTDLRRSNPPERRLMWRSLGPLAGPRRPVVQEAKPRCSTIRTVPCGCPKLEKVPQPTTVASAPEVGVPPPEVTRNVPDEAPLGPEVP
jgi:hypothetical protein